MKSRRRRWAKTLRELRHIAATRREWHNVDRVQDIVIHRQLVIYFDRGRVFVERAR